MKYLWLLLTVLAFIVLTPSHAHAQQGNTVIIRFAGAPSGSCSPVSIAVNNATGDFYDCKAAAWTLVSAAGGGCAQGTCVVNAPTADQTISGSHFLNVGTVGGTDAATIALNGVGIRPTDVSVGNNTLLYLDAQPNNPWHTVFHNIGDPATNFTVFTQATAPNYNFGIQSFTATNSPSITVDPTNNQINLAAGSASFLVNGSLTNAGVGATTVFTFGSDTGMSRLGAASLTLGTTTINDFTGALKLTTLTSVGSAISGTAAGVPAYVDKTIGYTTSAMGAQSSATCTNITNMTWNIAASKNYRLSCEVPITFAASATVAFCLGGPGTATSYSLEADGPIGTAAAYAQITTLAQTSYGTKTGASAAVGAGEWVHVKANIQNGATASGTALTLQTAANGTNNITVGANASCVLTQAN